MLTSDQINQFETDGYLVLRQRVGSAILDPMRQVVLQQLGDALAPVEYEAEVGYAGAPTSKLAPGGETVRRLRGAWGRDCLFQEWAADPSLIADLQQLFGEAVVLNLAHHNCIMTKHPAWGTATGWHRDIRYWSFSDPNLVTVWLALGNEHAGNGGLLVIPGSHRWQIGSDQLDALDFLRVDLPQNQALVAQGTALSLARGDVLFFHSSLFHAAGRNQSDERKLSVVFAYHGETTHPMADSRSAAAGEIHFQR